MTRSTSSADPASPDPLAPDFATEHDANAAGWQTITAPFRLPSERALACHVLAGFRGQRPGHRAVPIRVIGSSSRVHFARRAAELVHVPEPDVTDSPDELSGPFAIPAHLAGE